MCPESPSARSPLDLPELIFRLGAPYWDPSRWGVARLLPDHMGQRAAPTSPQAGPECGGAKESRPRSEGPALAGRRWAVVGRSRRQAGLGGNPPGLCFLDATPASPAPGPKGVLVLSTNLVNGWMHEGDRGWGRGTESRWLGEERESVGEGRWPLAGERGRKEAGGAGRACWSGI